MGKDALLGLFDILLTTSDLDFGFLSDRFLLLAVKFLVLFIIDIDPNSQLVPKPVYTSTLSTDNTTNVFTADFEFG